MRRFGILAVIAASLVLSGCAGDEPLYDAGAADRLQQQVLTVSETSAAGDFETALLRLDELVVQVNDALARGEITPERHQSILSAIELVRADLLAAIEAAKPPPAPEPEPEPAPEENAGNGDGNSGNGNDGGGDDGNDGDGEEAGNDGDDDPGRGRDDDGKKKDGRGNTGKDKDKGKDT